MQFAMESCITLEKFVMYKKNYQKVVICCPFQVSVYRVIEMRRAGRKEFLSISSHPSVPA